jgi:hypothetical protein
MEIDMSVPHGRTFIRSPHIVDGKAKSGYLIKCRACSNSEVIANATHSGSLPPEVTAKKFTQKGWRVGHRVRDDLCPACIAKELELKKKKTEPKTSEGPAPAIKMEIDTVRADPPPEITREDRRIIFSEIDSHYIDEMRGYDTGWNDTRVAEGLKVPLAWVKGIREDNFGPEFGSGARQEVLQMNGVIEKGQALQKKIEVSIRDFTGLLTSQERVLTELKKEKITTDQAISDLSKRINDLMKRIN